MVYEFVLKLFGKSAVELISLLPFLLTLYGERFEVEVIITEPCTKEMVRLIETHHPVVIQCDISVLVNDEHLFRQRRQKKFHYDSEWWSGEQKVGSSAPRRESFQFTFEGFRFDNGDKIDIFSVVTIENDTLFEKSTGFKSSVLWNYFTPSREELFTFDNGEFKRVDN